ncbi:mech3 protein [Ciona intestinalis]
MKSAIAFILVICFAVSADAAARALLRVGAKVVDAALPVVSKLGPHVSTGDYVHNNPSWSLWRRKRWSGNQQPTSEAEMLEDALEAEAIEALMQEQ